MPTKTTKKPAATKASAKKAVSKKTEELTAEISDVTERFTSIVEKVNTNIESAQTFAKQAYFAGLGLFGRGVEEAKTTYTKVNDDLQTRYEKINEDGQKLVKDLVGRGEKVQDDAEELLKEARENIEQQIVAAKKRVTGLASAVDIPSRLQEVSVRLESLSNDLKKSA